MTVVRGFKPYFEIIDNTGIIESPLKDFTEAISRLEQLDNEGFMQDGDLKIIEVHYIRA